MPQRSVCNGQLVKHGRRLLGITQEQLAARSGLSLRVVAKAEASGTLDHDTVEALAAAFCEAGFAVMAADLTSDPLTLARQFLANYAKYQADVVPKSLDMLSPNIVALVDGDPATNPIAGTYRGLAEFDGLWRKFFGLFLRDGGTLPDSPGMVAGRDVVMWGHENIRVPDVPPQPGGFVMVKMTFDQGLIVRFEDYYESTGMMRALEDWAEEFPDSDWTRLLPDPRLRAPRDAES